MAGYLDCNEVSWKVAVKDIYLVENLVFSAVSMLVHSLVDKMVSNEAHEKAGS
jgi:hypothetical protein